MVTELYEVIPYLLCYDLYTMLFKLKFYQVYHSQLKKKKKKKKKKKALFFLNRLFFSFNSLLLLTV